MCLSIIFGNWAKTFQPLDKLLAFGQKDFDKNVKQTSSCAEEHLEEKDVFFPKRSIAFSDLPKMKEGFFTSCQKFVARVDKN